MHDARYVGRTAELDLLVEALTGGPGRVTAVAVVGEPGIGKTRLLAELSRQAAECGFRVASGEATEYESAVPYAVLAEALEALVAGDRDPVDALSPELRDSLAAVMPSSGAGAGGGAAGGPRHRAHAAVGRLLDNASRSASVLLVLDDLHWADEGSLDALGYLLRHPPDGAVVLALAYRAHQAPGRLVRAVERAVGARTARRVQLGPLSESESLELLRPVPRADAYRIYRASEGNPLYLTALGRAQAGAAAGWTTSSHPATSSDLTMPVDIAAAVGADLDTVTPVVRSVAYAAAVLGSVFDAEAVAPVAQLSPPAVANALDALVERDIIRPDPASGRLVFRHPMLRHVVYEASSASWRRAAHARAVDVWRERGAPVTQWAHHVERSASTGDIAAVETLVRAATSARRRAPATAAGWYATALRLAPHGATGIATRGHLRLVMAESLTVAGRLAQSRTELAAARAEIPPHRWWLRRRAVVAAALVEQLLGRYDEAAAILRRELDTASDHGAAASDSAAGLWLELAACEVMRGEFAAARSAADEAILALAGRPAAPQRAAAGGIIALAQYTAGDIEAARETASAVGALVDTLSDAELGSQLQAVMWLGWTDSFLGRYPAALRRQDRALAIARRTGQSHLLTHLLVGQGGALRWVGRLVEARECYDEALEVARLSGSDELLTMALSMQCRIQTWLGNLDEAVLAGEEAVASGRRSGGWFSALAAVILAQARLAAGVATGCVETVLGAAGGPELPRLELGSRPDWYELLTRAALAAGEPDEAHSWASRAVESAARSGLLTALGFADLACAHDWLAGRTADAARAAMGSARAFDAAGNPLDAGRARIVAGSALAATGDRPAAVEVLETAERELGSCAAVLLQAEAAAGLRRLGRRTPAVARASGGGATIADLTPREQDVAALVADGRSNREIAASLFLSEKTIERHLSHVFAKLGISTRASLAARVAARRQV